MTASPNRAPRSKGGMARRIPKFTPRLRLSTTPQHLARSNEKA
jgi:hypothetical protein